MSIDLGGITQKVSRKYTEENPKKGFIESAKQLAGKLQTTTIQAVNPFVWDVDFPSVFSHTSVCFLKNCPDFFAAKRGSLFAAEEVVKRCAKSDKLAELPLLFPDAVLLPVMTENKLPVAFARLFGMKIHKKVFQLSSEKRKVMSATERLLHKPIFWGKIVKNQKYILIDDIITQGGTISALRDFVVSKGGIVVAVCALACAAGASNLAPQLDNILLLHHKFGLPNLLKVLGLGPSFDGIFRYTNAQIMHMLRFKNISKLEKKLGIDPKEKTYFTQIRLKIYTSVRK